MTECTCCLSNHKPKSIFVGQVFCVDCVEKCFTPMAERAAEADPGASIFDPGPRDVVSRKYIRIQFQSGPIKEAGPNGCQIDEIVQILIDRLEHFQEGPGKCAENNMAIIKLMEAKFWLEARTADRVARGVEGRSEP